MEEHVGSLPADAVEQCNAAIPRRADGTPKFPLNVDTSFCMNGGEVKVGCSLNSRSPLYRVVSLMPMKKCVFTV